ncbi:hypothetical protein ACLE20_13290 [Rhizobium sp. YIM 134829]|uniref:hypothetical protein n=1 Tax=Rhizobium sp. YIM 134829 TaxID=3390453 RepID=UPI00397845DE
MIWNLDIAAAPRDGRQILVATSDRRDEEHFFLTRWIKPTKRAPAGRFNGFSENSKVLLAWCELPLHPHHMLPADLAPVAEENIPIIDDAGGGV